MAASRRDVMVGVDVISDFVCPWCYIGKRNLDALRAEVAIETHWHPYFLHPDLPPEGIARDELMRAKFGSVDRARELGRAVEKAALDAGLFLELGRVTRIPSTTDAHRLMRWAAGQGIADRLAETLFAAHFADGRDIGDAAVLAELAESVGLDRRIVVDLLASEADREVVRAQAGHARDIGVTGVPTMIFERRLAVVGAQSVDVLREAVARAAATSE